MVLSMGKDYSCMACNMYPSIAADNREVKARFLRALAADVQLVNRVIVAFPFVSTRVRRITCSHCLHGKVILAPQLYWAMIQTHVLAGCQML